MANARATSCRLLLQTQLATLEVPTGEPGVVTVSIDATPEEITANALSGLKAVIFKIRACRAGRTTMHQARSAARGTSYRQERIIRQGTPDIETLCVACNGLAQYLAEQMRGGDTVAAVAMRKIDIVRQFAHMRDARQRQREIAARAKSIFVFPVAGKSSAYSDGSPRSDPPDRCRHNRYHRHKAGGCRRCGDNNREYNWHPRRNNWLAGVARSDRHQAALSP